MILRSLIATIPRLLADDPVPNSLFQNVDPNNSTTGGLFAVQQLIHNVVALALFIAGTLSVIFIVVAGLRYVLSAGSPSGTKTAKDTLLYAVIGLIVTLSTWAILAFATTLF